MMLKKSLYIGGCKVESVRFKVDFGPIQLREEGPKLTVEASHIVEKVQA